MISQSILLLISSVSIWEEIWRIGFQFLVDDLQPLTVIMHCSLSKSTWGDLSFRPFILFVSLPCLAYLIYALRASDIQRTDRDKINRLWVHNFTPLATHLMNDLTALSDLQAALNADCEETNLPSRLLTAMASHFTK